MILDVVWTDEATETFDITVNLIESKWGFASAAKFVGMTQRKIDLIAHNPYLYKSSSHEGVRHATITKQTSMVYKVYDNHITILFFFDNRQEPIL